MFKYIKRSGRPFYYVITLILSALFMFNGTGFAYSPGPPGDGDGRETFFGGKLPIITYAWESEVTARNEFSGEPTTKETTESTTKETTESTTKETTESTTKETTKQTTKETTKQTTKETTKQTTKDTTTSATTTKPTTKDTTTSATTTKHTTKHTTTSATTERRHRTTTPTEPVSPPPSGKYTPPDSPNLIPDGDIYIQLDENGNPYGAWVFDEETDKWVFTDNPNPPEMPEMPKTGDETDPRPWLVLLMVSAFILRYVLFIKRNKKKEVVDSESLK